MAEGRILESWKEIAAHLHRNVRTCQIWEHELGLPVHRLDGSPKARVFAYADELDRWLEEKLHEREVTGEEALRAGQRRRRLRNVVLAAALGLGVLLAAIPLWRPVFFRSAALSRAKKPSLAVVYFENNSGDASSEHWRSALSELLIADLSQSKYLRVVPGDEMYTILRDLRLLEARRFSSDDLTRIAEAGRADFVLKGSFVRAGGSFLITAAVQRVGDKEPLGSYRVEAEREEDVITRIDDLARRVKLDLDSSKARAAGDVDQDVGKITTSSPEAYRLYSEAWKLTLQMKSRESIPLLEKALAIDPEFAMGYRLLGIVYVHLDQRATARPYLEKALSLTSRISDPERCLVEAAYDMLRGERYYDRAIGALSKYLEYNPEGYAVYNLLGMIQVYLGEWDKARALFERSQASKPEYVISLFNVTNMWMAKGEYAKATKTVETHLSRYRDNAWLRRGLAFCHVMEKDYSLARLELDKAKVLDPVGFDDKIARGDLAIYEGDLVQAEREYKDLLERQDPEEVLGARIRLGWLAVLQGKFAGLRTAMGEILEQPGVEKGPAPSLWQQFLAAWYFLKSGDPGTALKGFRRLLDSSVAAEDLDYQRRALHGQGLACLAMDRMDDALRAAEELRTTVESKSHKTALRAYRNLWGCIELARGHVKPAIENLEEAVSLMPAESFQWDSGPQALMLDPLAQAYLRAGRRERAAEICRKITAMTSGRLRDGDIYAKAFYRLGKIADDQGDKTRAREGLVKFLELWKGADPGLPEVADAKMTLARLNK